LLLSKKLEQYILKINLEEIIMASKLVAPHGGKGLVCALLEGDARTAELEKQRFEQSNF